MYVQQSPIEISGRRLAVRIMAEQNVILEIILTVITVRQKIGLRVAIRRPIAHKINGRQGHRIRTTVLLLPIIAKVQRRSAKHVLTSNGRMLTAVPHNGTNVRHNRGVSSLITALNNEARRIVGLPHNRNKIIAAGYNALRRTVHRALRVAVSLVSSLRLLATCSKPASGAAHLHRLTVRAAALQITLGYSGTVVPHRADRQRLGAGVAKTTAPLLPVEADKNFLFYIDAIASCFADADGRLVVTVIFLKFSISAIPSYVSPRPFQATLEATSRLNSYVIFAQSGSQKNPLF